MLRKVGESAWPISEKDAVVSIKDASYPIPFPQGLEFNSPAHGCWNIVHTVVRTDINLMCFRNQHSSMNDIPTAMCR